MEMWVRKRKTKGTHPAISINFMLVGAFNHLEK